MWTKTDKRMEITMPPTISDDIFNLDSYAAQYDGHTKLARLQFIAEKNKALELDAYELLDKALKNGINTQLYYQVLKKLSYQFPDRFIYDESWVKMTENACIQRRDNLEYAQSDAKSKMVKESIRSAFTEMGKFQYSMGNFSDAMKLFLRSREYCSTPNHFCYMTLDILSLSIDSDKYDHATNIIVKAADCGTNKILLSKLRAASAIVSLNFADYKIAALKFLAVTIDLGKHFTTTITCEDIALYGSLLSIATFDRAEMRKHLIEKKPFINGFLPLFPIIRDITMDFYNSRYTTCLQNLEKLKPRLLLDIHLSKHTDVLLAMITEKCILQYCSTFRVVDMNRMTSAMDMDIVRLESLLAKLISEDRLLAKINSQTKTLVKQVVDAHRVTTQQLLQLSLSYTSQLKRDVLQLSLLEHGFVVDSKEEDIHTPHGGIRNSTRSSRRKGIARRAVDEEDEDDVEDCNAEEGEEDDSMDLGTANSRAGNAVVMDEQTF